MSDLISRSMYKSKLLKALDVLTKEYIEAVLNEDDDLILAIQNQKSAYMIALRLLDNEPTAYSVDEVIKELEENASRYTKKYTTPYGNNGYKDTKAISVKKAIEIVKQGGVSDDVCEWRLCDEESNVYDTSCRNPHILIEGTPKENNYEFCPYCGKKIKIVGD